MAKNSGIEWTDNTFNPWMGCTKVSPACKNCYAERDFDHRRGKVNWGPKGTRVKTSVANWKKPIKWNREAGTSGKRLRVFCASLADVFEDWQGPILDHNGKQLTNATFETASPNAGPLTMDDLRRDLFELIDATPNLDWLLLTKRPENVSRMWQGRSDVDCDRDPTAYHRPNVWIGASVENQKWYDERIEDLYRCKTLCENLFLSCEPLVGPVRLSPGYPVDWIITGGESGPEARAAHPDWYRGLRDQCEAAGTAFHFKQWGEWLPNGQENPLEDRRGGSLYNTTVIDQLMCVRVGKKKAGRLLDGRTHDGVPIVAQV